MKTIGLIGGLSWLSTLEYYKHLNQLVNQRLGGVSSAKILLYSVDFEEIKTLTLADDWDGLTACMISLAKKLEHAGADCLLIGANTMHHIAEPVRQAIGIPLVHIAEATAAEISSRGFKTVALLGTKYTMQLDFYKDILAAKGINVIIPGGEDIEFLNHAIYHEMGKSIFLTDTKTRVLRMIQEMANQGAEAAILACTELPILLRQEDEFADNAGKLPLLDTSLIHARAAVEFALG